MRQYILIGIFVLGCFYFLLGFSSIGIQENSPPKIKIIVPTANSSFRWNSILPYEIQVVDEEDGNSDYDEINPNEVFLIVNYVKDSSELKSYMTNETNTNYSPLVQMGSSTCFNCHQAKGNLIGPSFERIASKYNKDPNAVESLTNNVISGSTAVWGDEKMPPHPDIKVAQVQAMVRWILENNLDSEKNYMAGTKGTIKIKEQSVLSSEKGFLVLSASYTDHGSNDRLQHRQQGRTTLVLKNY